MQVPRLGIVTSHPVQYYAPWFRYLAATGRVDLRVFYLWDGGVQERYDPGFGQSFRWDVPLLDGYTNEFVPNVSSRPGSGRFFGLRNPDLLSRLYAFNPGAVLTIGYNHASVLRLIFARRPARVAFPLIFRGDSHRLVPRPRALRERLRRMLISAVYRRFSAFLYVGQANRDYFRWHNVPEDRLFLSPHAVDNDRFSANFELVFNEAGHWRSSLGISNELPLIVFAGKLEPKKRPLDLLAAFARLDASAAASLLFVGGGPLENELKARAANQARVYFAPFQNQSQMSRTYAAADLFVLPSEGGEETWGLAINEALCLSRPVIVSSHVGCAVDLVKPGQNGLIFPAGNVGALAEAIREALSDRKRLEAWGAEGRRIVTNFSYSQASEGLFKALEAVI